MSGNKSNAPGFLNKFFNKNKSQSGSDNRGDTTLENKPNSQLFFQLLELYDTYSNNYTYFKSICLEEEGSKDKPVMHGVQGLKSLITELRFELQKLNNKYPYLVVVKDPDNLTNDKIKVYNSLYGIVKQSEGVLQHVKEQESSEFPLSDKPKDNSPSLSRRKSNSNLLGKGANSAVNQNKMFNKRGMRTMRDYSSEYRANSSLKISDTGESKIPTYIEQKKLEQQREEQKAQKLSAVQNKSYSNTSRGSITSGKHKKQTSSKAKSTDVDDGQLVDLTDNASKMDLVDDIETNDPFEDFDAEFAQPKVKKPAKITTPPARRSFEAKPMNPSLQAATLAAVNKGLKPTQSGPVPTTHQQRPKPAVKTATTSKKIPILENSGQAATKNAATNDSSKKTDKDLLEDEILKQTPEIDYKVGKQIFQEILVARSNQRPLEWDDIIGLDNCKSQLKETIVFPFLRPDLFSGLREPINGLLLYGPPGTGKTMLAKCVAYQTDSTFFNVSVSSITSKFLGESEKLVRSVFTLAAKLSPSIIFIDEIDSLLGSRGGGDDDGGDDGGAAGESSRRFKNEFLTQWSNINYTMKEDGTYNRVLVLGCTNLPWVIDDAARRRFQKRIYCPLPNEADRIKLIEMLMSKNEIRKDEGNIEKNFTHEEMAELSKLTDGFSNSDLLTLCKDASMEPIRELIRRGDNSILNVDKNTIRNITVDDFKRSLVDNKVKGSVNLETLRNYDKWTDQFGS